MRYLGTFAGWIAAAVLAVAAGLLLSHNRTLSKQVAAYGAEADAFNRQAGAVERENGELRDRIASLEEQIDRSRESINALSEQVAQLTGELSGPASAEAGAGPTSEDMAAEAPHQSGDPVAGIMQVINDPELVQTAAEMAVDMNFGDFLQSIAGGDPEKRSQIREILSAYVAELLRLGSQALNPDAAPESAYTRDQLEARMHEDLSRVLTVDELALFDEYEAGMAARQFRQGIKTQLQMFARRMSEENRRLFADVYMEEVRALGENATFLSGPDLNVAEALEVQLEVLERTYERIAPSLTPDEQAALADFITQQERMYEMARRMIEEMLPDETPAQ